MHSKEAHPQITQITQMKKQDSYLYIDEQCRLMQQIS
jgi:hypothetical protein